MTNRRQFLQMLGVGGTSLLVTTTANASPIVPLFSGKESKIWTPEHTSLTRSHLVLTRPKVVPTTMTPVPGGISWGRKIIRASWPKIGGRRLYHTDEEHCVPSVTVQLADGGDAHEAFYKAAMQMRSDFAKQSQERLLKVPPYKRSDAMLVTLVDTDIFAAALYETRGFRVEISYTPYILGQLGSGGLELNGWEIYSENGEYPIEIPSGIDMDRLFSLDQRIAKGEMAVSKFGGRILIG